MKIKNIIKKTDLHWSGILENSETFDIIFKDNKFTFLVGLDFKVKFEHIYKPPFITSISDRELFDCIYKYTDFEFHYFEIGNYRIVVRDTAGYIQDDLTLTRIPED